MLKLKGMKSKFWLRRGQGKAASPDPTPLAPWTGSARMLRSPAVPKFLWGKFFQEISNNPCCLLASVTGKPSRYHHKDNRQDRESYGTGSQVEPEVNGAENSAYPENPAYRVRQGLLHDARALGRCVLIPTTIAAQRFSRDEDDDKFIHMALASEARWLVTGDQDLLVITKPLPIRILTPGQALQRDDFLA